MTGVFNPAFIALDAFRADPLFAGIDGSSQVVVVIDTGADLNHPAFGPDADSNGIADRIVFQYDFSGGNDANASDFDGHGSHVAGIVGSESNVALGIAPECGLIVLKVFRDSGGGSSSDTVEALQWVSTHRFDYNITAVNLSLGAIDANGNDILRNSATNTAYTSIYVSLANDGVSVIQATGNTGATNAIGIDATSPGAIGVGALSLNDPNAFAGYSNRSPVPGLLDIAAPGTGLNSTIPNDSYAKYSGTSMAAPVISGVSALMSDLVHRITEGDDSLLNADLFLQLMRDTADPFVDAATGATYLRVNVHNLANAVVAHYITLGWGWRGDDTITGTTGNNILRGGAGNDLLLGDFGDDSLLGGSGDDILRGGGGIDTYMGGEGKDTVDYSDATGGVSVDLLPFPTSLDPFEGYGGEALGEQLDGIEVLIGSAFADILHGGELYGGGGNDWLYGVGTLSGVLDGGSETDIAEFEGPSSQYVVISLGPDTYRLTDLQATEDAFGLNLPFGLGGTTSTANASYILKAIEGTTFLDGLFTLPSLVTVGATINGTSSGDIISPTAPVVALRTTAGNDTIFGNGGNDQIDGGGGADRMLGGAGDDTYTVNHVGDFVDESSAAGGTDLVRSSVSFILPDFVENLTLTGTADADGFGNALGNVITGNASANVLAGFDGEDVLMGGGGNDLLYGGAGDSGDLEVLGGDILDGGVGADFMIGGLGNDTYFVDDLLDTVSESDGTGYDVVHSTISFTLPDFYFEELILIGTANISGTGNELNNRITGNSGANVLKGGAGNDTIEGGGGLDTLKLQGAQVDFSITSLGNGLFTIRDLRSGAPEGFDFVSGVERVEFDVGSMTIQSVSTAATTGVFILGTTAADQVNGSVAQASLRSTKFDDTIFAGEGKDAVDGDDGDDTIWGQEGDDKISGSGGLDTLYGNEGNDVVDGGLGTDTLRGGAGNDTYVVDSVGDLVEELETGGGEQPGVEAAIPVVFDPGGIDTVKSLISFTLVDSVENLILLGVAASGTGNALNNAITGNSSANTLNGLAGADILKGGSGSDVINAGEDKDILVGGTGKDILTGGLGNDTFDFNSKSESLRGSNRDLIRDFNRGQDKIDLSTIDADTSANSGNDKFKFIGIKAFKGGGGELRYNDNGSTCTLQGDINGDKVADFEIKVNVGSLQSGDFLL